jgi:hypothetical protein
MNDTLLWFMAVAAGGGVPIITFITFWMTLSSRISEAQASANQADQRAKNAETLSTAALAKTELVSASMNDYRADVLAKIASLDAITNANSRSLIEVERRLAKAIEDISDKMDNLQTTMLRAMSEFAGRKD